MANGCFDTLVIRTVDILGDVEEMRIPQPTWSELAVLDRELPETPFWFDSDSAWGPSDFLNSEVYVSVMVFWE